MKKNKFLVAPDINNDTLTHSIKGVDQDNNQVNIRVIQERDLTIFLNNQEIVTLMSIGDHPKYLSIGYLLNQNMLKLTDKINSIQYDSELKVVVVRTNTKTNYEKILKKKITTSGCAQGTVFGNIYEEIQKTKINSRLKISTKWIYEISKKINLTPSLYLKAGAVHGCVIIKKNNLFTASIVELGITVKGKSYLEALETCLFEKDKIIKILNKKKYLYRIFLKIKFLNCFKRKILKSYFYLQQNLLALH